MKKPTLYDFLIRVGGLAAFVVIAIQLTKAFMPGYEAKVVVVISLLVICGMCIRTWVQRSKTIRKKTHTSASNQEENGSD